ENEVTQMGEAREKTHLFLKTLGHELRNPLGVLTNTQMILARLVTDERSRKMVEQMGTQLGVLRRLADDLMDVSRLELGKVDLVRERADLRELLQSATEDFADAARQKGIQLEAILPPAPLVVEVDR